MLVGTLHSGCSKGPYVPMDVTADPFAVGAIRDKLAIASTTINLAPDCETELQVAVSSTALTKS